MSFDTFTPSRLLSCYTYRSSNPNPTVATCACVHATLCTNRVRQSWIQYLLVPFVPLIPYASAWPNCTWPHSHPINPRPTKHLTTHVPTAYLFRVAPPSLLSFKTQEAREAGKPLLRPQPRNNNQQTGRHRDRHHQQTSSPTQCRTFQVQCEQRPRSWMAHCSHTKSNS